MNSERKRRELVALGHTKPFKPTDEQRQMVKVYHFNGLGEDRIADLLGISHDELIYHFAAELEYGKDELLGFATGRMFFLAGQNMDLGVALRANQHILQANMKRWRIPKDGEDPGDRGQRRLSRMSLSEVEEELARLDERRRKAASASSQESTDTSRKRKSK